MMPQADAKTVIPLRSGAREQQLRLTRLRTEANAAMLVAMVLLLWVPPLSAILGLAPGSTDALIADTFERVACMVVTWFAVYRIAHYVKATCGFYGACIGMLETWAALIVTAFVLYSVVKP